ncbi:MAG: sucrase ferredoxin [Pseudomonadota bacterium]
MTRSDGPRFCSEASIEGGEPLAGTGLHQERVALISWPKSLWGDSMRQARGMDDRLVAAIERVVSSRRRVNLIDRKGPALDGHRVFLFPERHRIDVSCDRLPDLLDELANGASLESWAPEHEPKSIVQCCTHGKYDRCCAKFGFASYRAILHAAAKHPGSFDIWESTHLGGCRLSATTYFLPQQRKYGRLTPDHAAALLDHEARRLPYAPCYRGFARSRPPAQCAEVAVLKLLSERGAVQPVTTVVQNADDNRAEVMVSCEGSDESFLVLCTSTRISSFGSCEDMAAGKATTPRIWHARSINQILGNQSRPLFMAAS